MNSGDASSHAPPPMAAREPTETGGLDRLLLLCLLKPPVTCRTREEMHAAVDFSFYFICF